MPDGGGLIPLQTNDSSSVREVIALATDVSSWQYCLPEQAANSVFKHRELALVPFETSRDSVVCMIYVATALP